MKDVIEEFIIDCEIRGLSPKTIKWYREKLNWFNSHYDWTQEGVSDFIKESLGVKRKTSINNTLRAVKTFNHYTCSMHNMQKLCIKFLKEEEVIKDIYTPAELQKLLKKPTSKNFVEWRTWALENILAGTGCRISTALEIKVEDINFDSNTILFRHSKNHRQQLFPLSNGLKKALKQYINIRGKEGYLICNVYGDKADLRSVQRQVADYNRARGVNKTSCHLFRHTFGSTLARNNVNAYNIMVLMNHSSMDMVNKYIHNYATSLNIDLSSVSPVDSNIKEKIRVK